MQDTGRRIYERIYQYMRLEGNTLSAASVLVLNELDATETIRASEMGNMVTTDRFLNPTGSHGIPV